MTGLVLAMVLLVAMGVWFALQPSLASAAALALSLVALLAAAVALARRGGGVVAPPPPSGRVDVSSAPPEEEFAAPAVAETRATRFRELFLHHGVASVHIPLLVPERFGIGALELQWDLTLGHALQLPVLGWAAETFGVRPLWLAGTDTRPYEPADWTRLATFYDFMSARAHGEVRPRVYAFKDVPELDRGAEHPQYVGLVVAEPWYRIGERYVYRYTIGGAFWDWRERDDRYQLKSIVRLCEQRFGIPVMGYDLEAGELEALLAGRRFPHDIIVGLAEACHWYPGDYTYVEQESILAREATENAALPSFVEAAYPGDDDKA